MTTHRTRAASPTSGPRIYLDAPRASTGTMLTPTYDTRFEQRPNRASFSAVPSTSSGRNNSVYETQPVRKSTYADPSHSGATISRTEYAVRPRRESLTSENRRPLSLTTKNTSPTRADYVDSPRDLVTYKAIKDDSSTRLLQPTTQPRGSVHHQRHNSATRAETGRYFGAAVPRVERAYHSRGPYLEKVADSRPPTVRGYVDEPVVEYTGPREQFDRDFPAKVRRESLTRRERPTSAMATTKFDQVPFRRDTAPAPPATSRQLQRIDRDEPRSGFESDPDRTRDASRRSNRLSRGPVVHQREDGYSSAKELDDPRRSTRLRPYEEDVAIAGTKKVYRDAERDRERPRRDVVREDERPEDRDRDKERRDRRSDRPRERDPERDRDRERDRPPRAPREYEVVEDEDPPRPRRRRENRDARDPSPDDSSKWKTLGTAALGGLAAAGIAKRKSDKDENTSDSESRKEARHRRRNGRDQRDDDRREDEDPEARRRRRERRSQRDGKPESSGSDTDDNERNRKRPQSRTRRRRSTIDGYGDEHRSEQPGLVTPELERRPSREPDADLNKIDASRGPVSERALQESPIDNDTRPLSPGEGEDDRPRKVSIVEPLKDKRDDVKPKGILKAPRAVPFPEDPNPTREGVAPLKQAGDDGIPPGARWTKVSRLLVNPEALQRVHERYEEREDYVIVLRVLKKEEIEKLALKTKEIREQREREWQKQVEERRQRRAQRGDEEEGDDFDDDVERGPGQLALEAPPTAPPVDLRQLAAGNNVPQHQYQPQPIPAYNPQQQAYPPQPQQQAYSPQPQQQTYPPQQPQYQPQQSQYQPQQQPYYQHQPQPQQPYPPQQYASQQWQNPGSAKNSGEAIANTAPGQPLPGQQQNQPQYDSTAYSQNV